MLKKFNMLILIVLLMCQTIMVPIAAGAEELDQQVENPDNNESANNVVVPDNEEDLEGSENEEIAVDETVESTVVDIDDDGSEVEPQTIKKVETNKIETNKIESKQEVATPSSTPKTTRVFIPNAKIEDGILKGLKVSLIDKNGKEVAVNQNEVIELDHPSSGIGMGLSYEFSLSDHHEYGAGSTYTFNLPNAFQVHNKAGGKLINPAGTDFGSFRLLANGTVIMTFNEQIEKNSSISGHLSFRTEIKKDFTGSTNQTIKFPINQDTTIEFPVQFKPKSGNAIDKRGIPNEKYNAQTISWEIDINKQLGEIKNVKLLDPLGNNQDFVADSIKVYKLDVQLDGSLIKGEEVTGHSYGTEFPLSFGDINTAYRIVFETEITDQDGTKYDNEAILTGENIDNLSAKSTVAVSRGEALVKSTGNYDREAQKITWEVKYNYNQKTIEQQKAFLVDTFGEGHEFVDGSVRVLEMEIDPNTGNEVGKGIDFKGFTISNETNGFQLQFKTEIAKAYKVIYQTKVTDRVLNDTIFTNKVIDGNNEEKVSSKRIGQQVFHKDHFDKHTDYDAKTTQWDISINGDKEVMHDVVLTDTLPKGLTLKSYTITHDGKDLMKDIDYTYSYDEASGEIEFQFINDLNPVTKKIKIDYTTSFDFNEIETGKDSFINKAKLVWTPENELEQTLERYSTFRPNVNTRSNGSKGGLYNPITKEIEWMIGVNYNNRQIESAVIVDAIQGDQNFDINSISVYKMKIDKVGKWTIDGEALQIGKDYQVEEMNGEQGFSVTLGKIDSHYVIAYKTDLNHQVVAKTYKNTAILKDGKTEFPLSTSVSVGPDHGRYLSKEVGQADSDNPRVLNWAVNINAVQSTISDVVITDKPSQGQIILKDSFRLVGTTVEGDGTFTENKDDELIEGTDYTLVYLEDDNGNEYFQLSFLKDIERPYVLKYDTYIMVGNNVMLKNDVSLTGTQIIDDPQNAVEEHQVKLTSANGDIDGRVGSLEVIKLDVADGKPLEGAEFTLYNETGEIAIKTLQSDEDGVAAFEDLLFGEYIIEETKAPEGYFIGEEVNQTITVDIESSATIPEGNQTVFENEELVRDVELTKVDGQTGATLEGAVFALLDQDKNQVIDEEGKDKYFTTGDDGKLTAKDLEPGTYYFIEKKAPKGYKISGGPIEFEIGVEQIETLVLDPVKNDMILGSAELIKGTDIEEVPGETVLETEEIDVPVAKIESPTELAEGSILPSTATKIFNLALIGFGLLLAGLFISILKRRKSI